MQNYRNNAPELLRNFLSYNENVRGKSEKTIYEYFLDLRTFLRFLKIKRGLTDNTDLSTIDINDVTDELITSATLTDAYDFLNFLAHEKPKHANSKKTGIGDMATTRARKISTLRSFYKYLTDKAKVMPVNPMAQLDSTKIKKSLPRYLSLDESIQLLSSVQGHNKERDFCILTLFLNCGLRVSELVAINISDIKDDHLYIIGKGNKERTVYLNNACLDAVSSYMKKRIQPLPQYKNALFISRNRRRINVQTVKWLVKKHLLEAGLDSSKYSAHKLRHTAATLMYQNGVDVRTLKDVLGHENMNTTMIYTHISDDNLRKAADMNPLSNIKPNRNKEKEQD